MTTKIHGRDAITHATATGAVLRAYASPTEPARDGLTVAEAREIAREDPSLVWCTAATPEAADEYAAAQ